MDANLEIRPSPLAGRWYPADPLRLARQIDEYLQPPNLPQISGEVIAVIVPHAGIKYSGPVAGYAFAALHDCPANTVVVASPMHYPQPGRVLTSAHAAYATPLGEVWIDRESLARLDAGLKSGLGFGLTPVAFDEEHSLEIELPFLQRALRQQFRLVPIMVRDQSEATARGLGQALARLITDPEMHDRRFLLVASTDLSHFFPQPVADALDREILRRVETFDPASVLRAEEEGAGFACGRAALAAVLWAAKELGAEKVQVLKHATSGDQTGDYSSVVGYAAAAVVK